VPISPYLYDPEPASTGDKWQVQTFLAASPAVPVRETLKSDFSLAYRDSEKMIALAKSRPQKYDIQISKIIAASLVNAGYLSG
jgi:hypothetical protein